MTTSAVPRRGVVALITLALLAGFLAYYGFTGQRLPLGAGPDDQAHYDVTRFIHHHKRLAVLPDDEASSKAQLRNK